jgi:hypothetical protein
MPVKSIEKIIDGKNVKIVQFHAIKGIKVKARLFKFILPVFSPFVGSLDVNAESIAKLKATDIDLQKMIPLALQKLSESIDPEEFLKLLLDLLSEVFVDGSYIDSTKFNDLFIGNYAFAYQLAYEVVVANNFFAFGGIGSLLQETVTQSPPEKSDQF